MKWEPDEKTREMDRLYRRLILVILSAVCAVLIVAFLCPRDVHRNPVRFFILYAISICCVLSIAFWSRSKVKKTGIPGNELLAYWSTKPLSRIAQLFIVILIIWNIYRAIKGK